MLSCNMVDKVGKNNIYEYNTNLRYVSSFKLRFLAFTTKLTITLIITFLLNIENSQLLTSTDRPNKMLTPFGSGFL